MIASNQTAAKKILIVTGETSGDQHGAKLIHQLKKLDSDLQVAGVGSDYLRHAGVRIIADSKNMAVVGAIEVISHLKYILAAYRAIKQEIKNNPPDLLIVIDYPEFNLMVAKLAKKAGIKVVYYISPQVWAWKQKRIKKIKKRIDKMLVIFPFEEIFYQRAHVPVEYVGHPLAGEVKSIMSTADFIEKFQIDPRALIVGILPGSRKGEIKRIFPTLLQAAEKILQTIPNIQFLVPLAPSLNEEDLAPYLKKSFIPVKIISHHFYDVVKNCQAAIVTSGTATLETALLETPMVIVYKTAASTYHIVKRIIKIPFIGLCNIVAGKAIVKELIQHHANPENISSEIIELINNTKYRETMLKELYKVKEQLGDGESSKRAALAVWKVLNV